MDPRNTSGAVIVVIETPGWKEFGEITAKVRSDREAQTLWAEMQADANPIGTIVNVDLAHEVN